MLCGASLASQSEGFGKSIAIDSPILTKIDLVNIMRLSDCENTILRRCANMLG